MEVNTSYENLPVTPEEDEAFNSMKPYGYDDHVSGDKVVYKDGSRYFGEDV